jgi:anti-sigma-K factor RskA
MKLDDSLRDLLAGEYVLGTLRGAARRRFERVLQHDPHLREAVAAWERRLGAVVGLEIEPGSEADPPPAVWGAIERRIGGAAPARERRGQTGFAALWENLAFWRGLGLAAAALLLLVSGLFFTLPGEVAGPERVAVVLDQSARPLWVISAKAQGLLEVTTINSPGMGPDRVCELWVIAGDAPPLSVGILPEGGRAVLRWPAANSTPAPAEARLAVSIEPAGGSPAGRPTGPVIFEGDLLPL